MEVWEKPENWNGVAEGYDDFIQPLFTSFFKEQMDKFELSSEMNVLDLACGPGTVSLQIQDRVARVESLDFSQEMVNLLKEKIEEQSLKNISTRVGNGEDLSVFSNESFDRVFSLFGLIFFPNRIKALKEVKRVLTSEGKAFLTSWPPMRESSFMTTLFQAMEKTELMPVREPLLPDVGTPDPEVFYKELREAGFTSIERQAVEIEVPITDVDHMWAQNVRGSVPILALKREMEEAAWNDLSQKTLLNLKESLKPPCSLVLLANLWECR